MSFKLKGLKEKRAQKRAEIAKLRDTIVREERGLNTEEQAQFAKLKDEYVKLGDQVKAVETELAAFDSLLAADTGEPDPAADPAASGEPAPQANSRRPGAQDRDHRPKPGRRSGDGADLAQRAADKRLAFQAWCRSQYGVRPTAEERAAVKRSGLNPRAKVFTIRIGGPGSLLKANRYQRRTMTAASNPTISQGFVSSLEESMLDFSNVRGVVDEFSTETGADLPYPTADDTSNEGEILGESAEVNFADPTLSSVTFRGYKFSSKGILVPFELLNDSEFDLASWLGVQIGTRIGRIQGRRFTTGTGTGQPQGIATAASAGLTTATAAAFTASELTRLAFAVDKAYRNGPSVGYMMNDSVVAYCLLLLDSQNRPLLRESFRDGIAEPMINGFPVFTNQYMTGTTAGVPVTATKHVLFGDFSKHKIRDVGSIRVRRLDERYAEKDQTGFIGFARADSRCVNTSAIKYLLQA